jgi:hypothetical protein
VELDPVESPTRPAYISNLATALQARFTSLGNLADLDEAIDIMRTSLSTEGPADTFRATYLSNLASLLRERAQRLGDHSALDEAIDVYRNAIAAAQPNEPSISSYQEALNDLLVRRRDIASGDQL